MWVAVRGGGKRIALIALSAGLAATFAACSAANAPRPAPSVPPPVHAPAPAVMGVASWYGPGFDGHPTSSGEIYHQDQLTAASTVIPLGSRVMVTNLDNGRSVEVRINDRGPFVKGRKIDLSHEAARLLGIVKPGTAQVRVDVLSVPAGSRPVGSPMRYYVQVGSYSQQANAERVCSRLSSQYDDVRIEKVNAGSKCFFRVRMGAFGSRDAAQMRARQSSRFGYPLIIVSE